MIHAGQEGGDDPLLFIECESAWWHQLGLRRHTWELCAFQYETSGYASNQASQAAPLLMSIRVVVLALPISAHHAHMGTPCEQTPTCDLARSHDHKQTQRNCSTVTADGLRR